MDVSELSSIESISWGTPLQFFEFASCTESTTDSGSCHFLSMLWSTLQAIMGSPDSSAGKESTCSAGDPGSIPGLGRSPGGGRGNLLQYSCLENPHGPRSLANYSPWGSQRVRHDWVTKNSTRMQSYDISCLWGLCRQYVALLYASIMTLHLLLT